ncbi:nitrate- and nitrite sensing domain-containing protein [Dactylosporangium sp. CA-139066]|uniref:sensor histidine kinase n=1 Tax=Dactylosporangium sp. CA-139066 TaxID=3239930 RepID=UPI003D89B4C5
MPALALMAVAGLGMYTTANAAVRAGETRRMAEVGAGAAELTDALQAERVAVATVLSPTGGAAARMAYEEQITRTAAAADRFAQVRAQLPPLKGRIREVLDRVDGGLRDVAGQRVRVRSGAPVALSTSTFSYRIAIAALIDYREAVAQGAVAPDLAGLISAGAALSRAKEAVGLEQVAVLQALASGVMSPALAQNVVAARASFTGEVETFQQLADPAWVPLLQRSLSGGEVLDATVLAGGVARTGASAAVVLPGGAAAWNRVMGGRVSRLRTVEQRVDADVVTAAAAARTGQLRQAAVQAGLVLGALLLALGVTAVVTRSLVRRVRALQAGALRIGQQHLPAVTSKLRTVTTLDEAQEVAAQAAATAVVGVTGRDEIGEFAAAFDTLVGEVLRRSSDLAVERITAAGRVLSLSRRVQGLIERLLGHVDELERKTVDADELARIFQIDNKAAQLRRLVGNLLVLSGGGHGTAHRRAEPLLDLVRGAQSQIEDYQRVQIGDLPDVLVDPRAALAVVHILAELMDNAALYSMPEHDVFVTGSRQAGMLFVQVQDRGVGMSQDALARTNALLDEPAGDLGILHKMGLAVVARLAGQLGIEVRLEPAPARSGLIGLVRVPAMLVRDPSASPTDRRAASTTPPAQPALPAGPGTTVASTSASTWTPVPTSRSGGGRHARPDNDDDLVRAGALRRASPVQSRGDETPTAVLPALTGVREQASPWMSGQPLGGMAEPGQELVSMTAESAPVQYTATGLPRRPRDAENRGPVAAAVPAPRTPEPPLRRDPAVIGAQVTATVRALHAQRVLTTINGRSGGTA